MTPTASENTRATMTVAALLNEFARGFDTEDLTVTELEELCRAWVQHFLEGSASPGDRRLKKGWRDWPGVQKFLKQRRDDERLFVTRNVEGLRQLVWEVVSGLFGTIAERRQVDGELRQQLAHLEKSARKARADELRDEVLATVQSLNGYLDERLDAEQDRLEDLGQQLASARAELQQARHAASIDGLTRLFNRAAFDEQLTRTVQLATLTGQPATLLLADIDHFKAINDSHGHPFGDTVLRSVADRLVSSFPRRTDFVARYGGEEFAVLLNDGDLDTARKLAERFRKRMARESFPGDQGPVSVTVSMGLAELMYEDDATAWLARADRSLYRAKQRGRDRVEA